jgi:hypothetical protein
MIKTCSILLAGSVLLWLPSCNKIADASKSLKSIVALSQGGGGHKITFVNNTGEVIYLGIWGQVRGAEADHGYSPPSGWSNWKMEIGTTKIWTAPAKFNGRFFARSGCNTVTGICTDGDCGGIKCTASAQPVSLAEFNMDDGSINWYDVSYVDGYNFPITITNNTCTSKNAGCDTLPTCPWSKRGGVCYSSCKEFSAKYITDYTTRDEFYKVCCKCKTPANQCGCGAQCGSSLSNCTAGWGCSIYANYTDPLALAQCCCSPLRSDQETAPINTCAADGAWPTSYDGLNYTSYPRDIKDICSNSYTWQYHDEEGLYTCDNASGTPVNFTITFHPRP